MDIVIDLDNEQTLMRIGSALPSFIEPYETVYVIDFGDCATGFYQRGDGTDPDDGEPWTTGLVIYPDDIDVTIEVPAGGNDPGPERENPEHRTFYRELFALGQRWWKENEEFYKGAELPDRDERETELRGLFERWGTDRPTRIAVSHDRNGGHGDQDDAVRCDGCPCCDPGDPDARCPTDQFRDPVKHICSGG